MTLRNTLIEVACARQATEGQQTKMEMVYQYLTGPRFRQRVQAIVEAFSSMQEDLDKERKALEKLSGDRKGQHSIRINDKWRICFRWHQADAYDVEITDYH